MEKWNLIIDVDKCENCNNCLLACKDEHVDNEFEGYTLSQPKLEHQWIRIEKRERGQYPFIDVAYLPIPCFHCDDAPCVKAAKNGEIYKRKDGIVIIDPEKSRGQRNLVKACPYHAITWNETLDIPQKCTLCAHLLDDGWKVPRCVSVCPTNALRMVKAADQEMKALETEENLAFYQPRQGFRHRVHYKNLHLFTRHFIGGTVATTSDGKKDCVGEADVILLDTTGKEVVRTTTDFFGDFKFEDIADNAGRYIVKISRAGLGETEVSIDMTDHSVFIGEIAL